MKMLKRPVKHLSYGLILMLMTACSGSFTGSSSGGPSVTGGNSVLFSPAVESTSMDLDNVYNINFINNLVIQDLCGGNSSGCDPQIADVIALLESYDLEVPESILNGEFELPTSGSAMVAALNSGTTSLRKVENYCTEAGYSAINVQVSDGLGGTTSMTLAQYMEEYRTMDNGARLKICEILNLRDEIKKEVKLNTASRYGYLMNQDQINETIRLRARREFLYVFVNSFLAFGTDLIGALQYLGIEVPDEAAQAFATSVNKINEGINKNKYSIREINETDSNNKNATIETKQFFNENKGSTYLFVEQFISQGSVKTQDPVVVEYNIDPVNFCKFMTGNPESGMQAGDYDQCVSTSTDYFNKVKLVHRASGDKYVRLEYLDAPYVTEPLPLLNLKYTIDNRSLIEIVLEDVKKGTIAIMRNELENHPDIASQMSITQSRVDSLNSVTLTGSFGIGGAITDLTIDKPLEESNLPAKLYASITQDLYVLIPQNMPDEEVNLLLDPSGQNTEISFRRDNDGDVSVRLGKSDDTVKIQHMRGNNLYQDLIGINLLNANLKFPPYELSTPDLFVFDISLDELNGDIKVVKPTELSTLDIKKDGTLRNFVKLSDLDVQLMTTSSAPTNGSSSREFVLQGVDAKPWNLQLKGDVDSLSSSLKDVIANQSQGMIRPNDTFDMLFSAPQGNLLEKGANPNVMFIARAPANTVDPINFTLGLNLDGHAETIGPVDLVQGINNDPEQIEPYMMTVMEDIMTRYQTELGNRTALVQSQQSGSFSGNLDCGANGTLAASVTISRTPAASQDMMSVTSSHSVSVDVNSSNLNASLSNQPYTANTTSSVDITSGPSMALNYQSDADNVIQSVNVTSYDDGMGLSCSGVLARNP